MRLRRGTVPRVRLQGHPWPQAEGDPRLARDRPFARLPLLHRAPLQADLDRQPGHSSADRWRAPRLRRLPAVVAQGLRRPDEQAPEPAGGVRRGARRYPPLPAEVAGGADRDALQPHRRRCAAGRAGRAPECAPATAPARRGLGGRQRRPPASGQGPGYPAARLCRRAAAPAAEQPAGDPRQRPPGRAAQGPGLRTGYRRARAVPRPGRRGTALLQGVRRLRPEFRPRAVRHGPAGGHGCRCTADRHRLWRRPRSGGRGRHPLPAGRRDGPGRGPDPPGGA